MLYRERVTPPVSVILAGALIVPAVILVFAPISFWVGVILGLVAFGGYCVFLFTGSPVIEVDAATLRVGSARVPLHHVGSGTAYTDRESARAAAGPGLDARAWTCLRGWVPTSAAVDITDAKDPIPYWLFSTRHPDEVIAAIRKAKARPRGVAKGARS